ncbi:MAG: hypothetical protein AB7U83_14625 [Vicinamibacterales bacterium]
MILALLHGAGAATVSAQSAVPAGELAVLPVPGGAWAFAELGIPAVAERASIPRLLVQRRYDESPAVRLDDATLARVQAQLDLAVRVEQAARRAAPDGVVALAAVKSRQARDRLREAVEAIGGRLRERRGQYAVELDDGRRARDLHAALKALGLDVAALTARLNRGDAVPFEIPSVDLPLPLSASTWARVVFERDLPPRELFAELLRDSNALLLWRGALALDAPTRRVLDASPDLVRTLHRDAAALFAAFGASYAVRGGRVQVAGDPAVVALWETLVGEPLASPAPFARRLFTRDGGRLAAFFDLVQSLPEPQRRFATGAWIENPQRRLDRFRALYDAVARASDASSASRALFAREAADPWLLLRGLAVGQSAAGNGLAGPQQRRFWDRAFESGLPDDPARVLRDVEADGLVDAAWLVERVCNDNRALRPTRFRQVLVLPRALPVVADADLPGALLAARGLAEFPALLLVLERIGVLSPVLAADAVRRAEALQRMSDRSRRALALAQVQGGVALVDRLVRSGTLEPPAAAALLSALMAVPLGVDGFGAGVAGWLVDRVTPRLPQPAEGLDAALVDALATRAGPPGRVTWAGRAYVVDGTAVERERLSRLRQAQGGASLDVLARALQMMRRVAQGTPSPDKSRDEIREIAELEKAVGRPRGPDEITEPIESTRVLPQARRELERVRGPRDRDRTARAAERLGDAVEWLTMHLLLSVAYTPHLGDPADGASAADGFLRHRFGVHDASEGARRDTPWSLPVEADDTGGVLGAVLALDHALARTALRRLESAEPPTLTRLSAANVHGLALQAALAGPRDATAAELQDVVAALTRGRERVQGARSDPVRLDGLAEAGRLSADRRAALSWMVGHEPARVVDLFTLAELVRIGEPTAALPQAFGTPTLAFDGRLRLEWRGAEPWEPYAGRPALGLLAAATADLPLRVAELTVQAGLPPQVYPAVLAYAAQDVIDSAELASSEDWFGLGRRARHLTRERFAEYVDALVRLGVLTAADPGR